MSDTASERSTHTNLARSDSDASDKSGSTIESFTSGKSSDSESKNVPVVQYSKVAVPSISGQIGPPPGYSESQLRVLGWQAPSPYSVVQQQPTSSVLYVSRNSQTVIINQSGLISPSPVMLCVKCNTMVRTQVSYRPGCQTHTWACVFCFFGCCLCAPIPYFTSACMDERYYCSVCSNCIESVS